MISMKMVKRKQEVCLIACLSLKNFKCRNGHEIIFVSSFSQHSKFGKSAYNFISNVSENHSCASPLNFPLSSALFKVYFLLFAGRRGSQSGGPPRPPRPEVNGASPSPFGNAAIQATQLPGQNRLPGGSHEGVAAALSSVSGIDDPKHKAFHSVNPEILELASQAQDLKAPPVKVSILLTYLIFKIPCLS